MQGSSSLLAAPSLPLTKSSQHEESSNGLNAAASAALGGASRRAAGPVQAPKPAAAAGAAAVPGGRGTMPLPQASKRAAEPTFLRMFGLPGELLTGMP
jgi:hypothetical protein